MNFSKKNWDDSEELKNFGENGALGLSLGLCLGVSFGIIFHNLVMGIGIGMALGLSLGSSIKFTNTKNYSDED